MRKIILLIVILFVSATCAFSTPYYSGDTYADWGVGGVPDLPTATGYYIWTNDDARTSWSVRWTGNNNGGTTDAETWGGSVQFVSNDLVTVDEVMWETSGQYQDGDIKHVDFFGFEYLFFTAKAGPKFDGFDFTLTGDLGGFLRFNLGGSFYEDLVLVGAPGPGVAATSMWIGNANVMNVYVENNTGSRVVQSFETTAPSPVPEPATLLLLGSGLVGLAFLKRRKS